MERAAKSWHMKLKKKVTWLVKRLRKRKELLKVEPVDVRVQVDKKKVIQVANMIVKKSIPECEEDRMDLVKCLMP